MDNATRHAVSKATIGLRAEAGSAVLAVADDGAGIVREERERIFERFTRLDEARALDQGGYGGLAITREIVVTHGGTVGVEGDAPGACLVVHLPLDERTGQPGEQRSRP